MNIRKPDKATLYIYTCALFIMLCGLYHYQFELIMVKLDISHMVQKGFSKFYFEHILIDLQQFIILLPALGLALKKRTFIVGGFSICLLVDFLLYGDSMILRLLHGNATDIWFFFTLVRILVVIFAIVTSLLQGKEAIIAGFLTGLLQIAFICIAHVASKSSVYNSVKSNPYFFVRNLLLAAGLLLLGGAVAELKGGISVLNSPQQVAKPTKLPIDDVANRLMQLKGLLDKEVISQEEFDKKKKEIIGE